LSNFLAFNPWIQNNQQDNQLESWYI